MMIMIMIMMMTTITMMPMLHRTRKCWDPGLGYLAASAPALQATEITKRRLRCNLATWAKTEPKVPSGACKCLANMPNPPLQVKGKAAAGAKSEQRSCGDFSQHRASQPPRFLACFLANFRARREYKNREPKTATVVPAGESQPGTTLVIQGQRMMRLELGQSRRGDFCGFKTRFLSALGVHYSHTALDFDTSSATQLPTSASSEQLAACVGAKAVRVIFKVALSCICAAQGWRPSCKALIQEHCLQNATGTKRASLAQEPTCDFATSAALMSALLPPSCSVKLASFGLAQHHGKAMKFLQLTLPKPGTWQAADQNLAGASKRHRRLLGGERGSEPPGPCDRQADTPMAPCRASRGETMRGLSRK